MKLLAPASPIKSIQRGELSKYGHSTRSATISMVNLSKTTVRIISVISASGANGLGYPIMTHGVDVSFASETSIVFNWRGQRYNNTDVELLWEVIEYV
ncbi:MAG: hypothetical protein JJV99_02225 [Colwellia sp.]|nr:hypothetical protein [Colwellia sp.]